MIISTDPARPGPCVQALFPEPALAAGGDPAALAGPLLPEETAFISGAGRKRRMEFTAGRLLARGLLDAFGRGGLPLLNGEDRAPRWPPGLVGSISHTRGYCAAVVAPAAVIWGLGLDVEPASPLKPGLQERICTRAERSWLLGRPADERGRLAKLLFSAKESVYKCQYPLSHRFLSFQDVQLEVDLERETFAAFIPGLIEHDRIPDGMVAGRFAFQAGWVLTSSFLK